jgi:hypothetical protein
MSACPVLAMTAAIRSGASAAYVPGYMVLRRAAVAVGPLKRMD